MNLNNYSVTRTGKDAFEEAHEWVIVVFETEPGVFKWWLSYAGIGRSTWRSRRMGIRFMTNKVIIELPTEELADEFMGWWLDGGGEWAMYEGIEGLGGSTWDVLTNHITYNKGE